MKIYKLLISIIILISSNSLYGGRLDTSKKSLYSKSVPKYTSCFNVCYRSYHDYYFLINKTISSVIGDYSRNIYGNGKLKYSSSHFLEINGQTRSYCLGTNQSFANIISKEEFGNYAKKTITISVHVSEHASSEPYHGTLTPTTGTTPFTDGSELNDRNSSGNGISRGGNREGRSYIFNLRFTVYNTAVIFRDLKNKLATDNDFILDKASPLGGTYSGKGVVNGRFYPKKAGVGEHIITYTLKCPDLNNYKTSTSRGKIRIYNNLKEVKILSLPKEILETTSSVVLSSNILGGVYKGVGVSGKYFYPSKAKLGNNKIEYTVHNPIQGNVCCSENIKVIKDISGVKFTSLPKEILDKDISFYLDDNRHVNISGGYFTVDGIKSIYFNPSLNSKKHRVEYILYNNIQKKISCSTFVKVLIDTSKCVLKDFTSLTDKDARIELNGYGFPGGGYYTINGKRSTYFDPKEAGLGNHRIRYTYENSIQGAVTRSKSIKVVNVCNKSLVLDASKNYIISETYISEKANELNSDVTYYDGMGRSSQIIQYGASSSGADIIQPIKYDEFGRSSVKYLPYVKAYNIAAYDNDACASQKAFYKKDKILNCNTAFAETVFDGSSLNRVVEQGSEGKDWQPQADNKGHTIKIKYLTNEEYEVPLFRVNVNKLWIDRELKDIKTCVPHNVYHPFYEKRSLSITQTFDEDWKQQDGDLHSTKEYKDMQGRTILKRCFVEGKNGIETLSTYYVYDVYGDLRYVLPPLANGDDGVPRKDLLNSLCYYYEYDGLHRMIEKRLPGVDPVYMVYDKKDRLVLTQDGKQRSENTKSWMYFNYDSFNRAIETGYCVENKAFKLLSDEIGKSLNYLPSTISKVLTKTFYDNYNFAGAASFISATDKSCNLKYTDKVKGLVTGTKVRVLGISDERWITTTNYYDSKYRLVQSVKNLYHDGKSVVSNRYNFIGNVLQTKESQTFNNSTKIVDTYFAYDHRSRLLNVSQSLDGLKQRILVSMEYNELGQLINKKLNGSIDVKYAYNIRGWLKKINSQKFGMSLYYNDSVCLMEISLLLSGRIQKLIEI